MRRAMVLHHAGVGVATVALMILGHSQGVSRKFIVSGLVATAVNAAATLVVCRSPSAWIVQGAGSNTASAARAIHRAVAGPILLGIGIGTWALLAGVTGGATSPFVTGLWLEIALAPLVLDLNSIPWVVAGAGLALWSQQCVIGLGSSLIALWVESSLLVTTGVLTYFLAERFRKRERSLSTEAAQLNRELKDLELRLSHAEALGRLGERVGRLAHAAKNTVHSLRGYAALIEEPLSQNPIHGRALQGLRVTIDRLEELTQLAFEPDPALHLLRGSSAADVSRLVEEVIDEIRVSHGAARTINRSGDAPRDIALSPSQLRNVLLVLLENAAEASAVPSAIDLVIEVRHPMLHLSVRDRGSGIAPAALIQLFQPGVTTKRAGNGYGLFLARRTIEAAGGQLTAEPAQGGGAVFSLTLPIQEAQAP